MAKVSTYPVGHHNPCATAAWDMGVIQKSTLHVLNEYWPEEGGGAGTWKGKEKPKTWLGFSRWQQSDPGKEITTAKTLLAGRWAVTPSLTCWQKSAWLLATPAPSCLQASFCQLALTFVLCSSSFLELPDIAIKKGDAG